MKSIEIQNLDQHLKPLQVDGVSTGLELSTEGFRISSGELEIKTLTSETAKVNENLVVGEEIKSNIITTAGNIVSGDDIAVASTGKLSLDGIGGHTYMVESSDDTVRLYVGGDII